jgi:hypothetical protein
MAAIIRHHLMARNTFAVGWDDWLSPMMVQLVQKDVRRRKVVRKVTGQPCYRHAVQPKRLMISLPAAGRLLTIT